MGPMARHQAHKNLVFELGVHGDFGVQKFGDGAALLGVFCGFIKFGFVGAGNLYLHLKMAGGNGKSAVDFFKRYRGGSID